MPSFLLYISSAQTQPTQSLSLEDWLEHSNSVRAGTRDEPMLPLVSTAVGHALTRLGFLTWLCGCVCNHGLMTCVVYFDMFDNGTTCQLKVLLQSLYNQVSRPLLCNAPITLIVNKLYAISRILKPILNSLLLSLYVEHLQSFYLIKKKCFCLCLCRLGPVLH